MLIVPIQYLNEPPASASVEIRYPCRCYPVEYRWRIPHTDWEAALELLDEEPALEYLPLLDRSTRTLDRLAWADGYDFGSEERRDALCRLYRVLMPVPVLRKLGLDWLVLERTG